MTAACASTAAGFAAPSCNAAATVAAGWGRRCESRHHSRPYNRQNRTERAWGTRSDTTRIASNVHTMALGWASAVRARATTGAALAKFRLANSPQLHGSTADILLAPSPALAALDVQPHQAAAPAATAPARSCCPPAVAHVGAAALAASVAAVAFAPAEDSAGPLHAPRLQLLPG